MPKFSDAEKEFIRQKLMQEGERLFVSFGIKKVSIDEIVQATGIAKGSFYSFYQSKEHLYMDIAGNLQMRMWQEMDEFLNDLINDQFSNIIEKEICLDVNDRSFKNRI